MTEKQKQLAFWVMARLRGGLVCGRRCSLRGRAYIEADEWRVPTGRTLIGVAVPVFQIVSAVAMMPAGGPADRNDIRLVFGGGVFIGAVGLGGMAVAQWPTRWSSPAWVLGQLIVLIAMLATSIAEVLLTLLLRFERM